MDYENNPHCPNEHNNRENNSIIPYWLNRIQIKKVNHDTGWTSDRSLLFVMTVLYSNERMFPKENCQLPRG